VGDILVVEVLIRIVVNHRGNYKAVISQRSVFTFLFSSFRLLVFTPTNSHFRTFASRLCSYALWWRHDGPNRTP